MIRKQLNGQSYIQNQDGDWVPESNYPAVKIKNSELTEKLLSEALDLHEKLTSFKAKSYNQVYNNLIKMGEVYDTVINGTKGITISSIAQNKKVQISFSQYLVADERVEVARTKMSEIIKREMNAQASLSSFLSNLFSRAFEIDKQGRLDCKELIKLAKNKADGVKGWNDACDLLLDSITTSAGKKYIRFYTKSNNQKWEQIVLNFSSL